MSVVTSRLAGAEGDDACRQAFDIATPARLTICQSALQESCSDCQPWPWPPAGAGSSSRRPMASRTTSSSRSPSARRSLDGAPRAAAPRHNTPAPPLPQTMGLAQGTWRPNEGIVQFTCGWLIARRLMGCLLSPQGMDSRWLQGRLVRHPHHQQGGVPKARAAGGGRGGRQRHT